jgi:hypothetical protein
MGLIEVENDSRDKRIGAVLAGAHAAHPVRIHRDASKVVVAGGIGKIEQNAVWIGRRFKRRLYGGTEREFHTQIGSLKRRRHTLHRRCPGAVLCGCAGQQEHQNPEMFLNCLHSLLTLAGVPSAAWSLAFPSVFASARHQPKQHLSTASALVALITINAVVDISRHIVVLEIIRVIAAMATGALEDGVVVRIDMAGGAHVIRIAVIRRELRVLRVIERSPGPRRGVVAGCARGREELRLRFVARVCRVVVVRLMAADARDGQRRVIVVDVAVRANPWRHHV